MKEATLARARRMAGLISMLAVAFALSVAWTALANDPHADGAKGDPHAEGEQGTPHTDAGAPARGDEGRSDAAPRGKAKGRSKSKSKRGSKAKGKSESRGKGGSKGESGEHPSGKTTLCHSTGSATNPYVTITVSNNALKAHSRHHDGRDIIPAPASGCPGGAEAKSPEDKPKKDHRKVTICHATGSETNPYVKITISENAVEAHRRHQDGRDIIPAPEGDCPGAAGTTPTSTATPGGPVPPGGASPLTGPLGPVGPAPATAPAAVLPATGEAPTTGEAPATGEAPTSGVLGERAEGGSALESAPGSSVAPLEDAVADEPAAQRAAEGSGGSLPFTGFQALAVLLMGAALLFGGLAVRRLARPETY